MQEKILQENPNRFVIFPIEHNDIWEFYKQHQAAFWTAEEIDLSQDLTDWDEKLNKVYTKKFVKITRPGEIIYGYGFEANQDFTRWEINAITGRIKVDGLADDLEE